MIALKILFAAVLFVSLMVSVAVGQKDKLIDAKESIALGMDMLKDLGNNPSAMKETLAMLNDPSTKAEIEALMKDPAFKREMEKLKSNPVYMNAIQGAKEMFNDPEKVAQLHSQIAAHANQVDNDGTISDVALGIQELSKSAKNPKVLAEAMEMLKDPEVVKEVQAMMKDPSFQAEMKRYTDSPAFKSAMSRASDDIEKLSNDPARLKKLEADFAQTVRS